jgi:uncharacterized membrane protein YhaH (DUF805 family)
MLALYVIAGSNVVESSQWEVLIKVVLLLLFNSLIVANIALSIKRIHDINLSGWCWLIYLLPFVSYLFSCGVTLIDGTVGPNRFEPDPKGRVGYQTSDRKGLAAASEV